MDNKLMPIKKEEEFDIKKLLHKFMIKWKWYVLSLVIFVILAILFIKLSTPMFAVHSQVLIEDNDEKGSTPSSTFIQSSLMQDFSGLFDVQSNVYNQMAILKTIDLLEETVNELHLNVAYYQKSGILSTELFRQSPFRVNFYPKDSILLTEFEIRFK